MDCVWACHAFDQIKNQQRVSEGHPDWFVRILILKVPLPAFQESPTLHFDPYFPFSSTRTLFCPRVFWQLVLQSCPSFLNSDFWFLHVLGLCLFQCSIVFFSSNYCIGLAFGFSSLHAVGSCCSRWLRFFIRLVASILQILPTFLSCWVVKAFFGPAPDAFYIVCIQESHQY